MRLFLFWAERYTFLGLKCGRGYHLAVNLEDFLLVSTYRKQSHRAKNRLWEVSRLFISTWSRNCDHRIGYHSRQKVREKTPREKERGLRSLNFGRSQGAKPAFKVGGWGGGNEGAKLFRTTVVVDAWWHFRKRQLAKGNAKQKKPVSCVWTDGPGFGVGMGNRKPA